MIKFGILVGHMILESIPLTHDTMPLALASLPNATGKG